MVKDMNDFFFFKQNLNTKSFINHLELTMKHIIDIRQHVHRDFLFISIKLT